MNYIYHMISNEMTGTLLIPLNELKKTIPDEIFLKEKYVEEDLSSKEIADLTFSSRPLITKLLKKYNIPLKV